MRVCSVPGCSTVVRARGLCNKHYVRLRKHGSTEYVTPGTRAGEAKRFLEDAIKSSTDACIEWPFHRNRQGYGRLSLDGRCEGAHRAVLLRIVGQPAPNQEACHSCANPSCINPRHLRWDTRKANMADRRRHGNQSSRKGGNNGRAILTADDVRVVLRELAAGTTAAELGRRFGVSRDAIYKIKIGKNWSHIKDAA